MVARTRLQQTPSTDVPFASRAQQRYLYAHPDKVGGADKLKEWSDSTNFSSLPQKAPQQKRQPGALLKKKKPYLPQGISSGM